MITNILMAIGLMICGFVAFAFMYFLRKNTWNGFKNIQKVSVALGLFSIISILLVAVPEAAQLLKTLLGLDVSIESSKVGFITLGLAFAGIVSTKLNDTTKVDGGVCNGIYDISTGLWLTSWNATTQTATWGSEQDALCLSEDLQSSILDILNTNTNNFIGARPRKPNS